MINLDSESIDHMPSSILNSRDKKMKNSPCPGKAYSIQFAFPISFWGTTFSHNEHFGWDRKLNALPPIYQESMNMKQIEPIECFFSEF